MPSFCRVAYVSRSLATPSQVQRILATSRSNNSASDITGALLFSGGFFAQVLEGSPEPVAALMTAISADPRHEGVTLLLDKPVDSRRFPDWSLAYVGMPGVGDLIRHLVGVEVEACRAERLVDLLFNTMTAHAGTANLQASSNGALNS
jgi:hypothetical protein